MRRYGRTRMSLAVAAFIGAAVVALAGPGVASASFSAPTSFPVNLFPRAVAGGPQQGRHRRPCVREQRFQ